MSVNVGVRDITSFRNDVTVFLHIYTVDGAGGGGVAVKKIKRT